MTIVYSFIILWIVCAAIRCKVFTKLEIVSWYSLIPFFGTYMVFKKVWTLGWYILYMVGFIGTVLFMMYGISDITAAMLFLFLVLVLLIGWTGEKYYLAKALNTGLVSGCGLALLYPVFLALIGFKKSEEKSEE